MDLNEIKEKIEQGHEFTNTEKEEIAELMRSHSEKIKEDDPELYKEILEFYKEYLIELKAIQTQSR